MGIFNKLSRFLNKIFRRNNNKQLDEKETVKQLPTPEINEPIELPKDELVSFSDEVLDTTSKVSVEKFKHNLEVLIKKAKETGKVDKFMLIREDDFFPTDWEWKVLSEDTNLEKECTTLSTVLRKKYALEKSGIAPHITKNGIKIPRASHEQTMQALSQIDNTFGSVLLPSKFRSTKHFTINTPLNATGDYNNVKTNRDYIIIDNISTFLTSEYGYSVSYHDAYLDISHESLPISQEAVVLINDENYERIISDEKIASELAQRRIVRFKGEEFLAINMILTEMGALPSKMGLLYANYDNEINDILDNSMRSLAKENGLFFDKSHGGKLSPDGGHFSNYYDEKNNDYEKNFTGFITFLRQKFPEHEGLFQNSSRLTEEMSIKIVDELGTTNLSEAIEEYNELASNKLKMTLEEYKQDRQNITPEIHQQFVQTIALINDFYKNEIIYESNETKNQTEEAIQKFLQGKTVSEQLEAAKNVWKSVPNKNLDKTETPNKCGKVSFNEFVLNALQGTDVSLEDIEHNNELFDKTPKQQAEEETHRRSL